MSQFNRKAKKISKEAILSKKLGVEAGTWVGVVFLGSGTETGLPGGSWLSKVGPVDQIDPGKRQGPFPPVPDGGETKLLHDFLEWLAERLKHNRQRTYESFANRINR